MSKFENFMDTEYIIERDLFSNIFKSIDELLWDNGWDFTGDYFKAFRIEDTFYMLNYENGILISFYKHLGRCNACNFELTLDEYNNFALGFLLDINGRK